VRRIKAFSFKAFYYSFNTSVFSCQVQIEIYLLFEVIVTASRHRRMPTQVGWRIIRLQAKLPNSRRVSINRLFIIGTFYGSSMILLVKRWVK